MDQNWLLTAFSSNHRRLLLQPIEHSFSDIQKCRFAPLGSALIHGCVDLLKLLLDAAIDTFKHTKKRF